MLRLMKAFLARLVGRRAGSLVAATDPSLKPPPLYLREDEGFDVQSPPQIEPEALLTAVSAAVDEFDVEEEDDTVDDEDDEADDNAEIDPFISLVVDQNQLEHRSLADQRAASRIDALSREHKVFISTVAGPGSLAEALIGLLREGRVKVDFVEPPGEDPHLLYRPILNSPD